MTQSTPHQFITPDELRQIDAELVAIERDPIGYIRFAERRRAIAAVLAGPLNGDMEAFDHTRASAGLWPLHPVRFAVQKVRHEPDFCSPGIGGHLTQPRINAMTHDNGAIVLQVECCHEAAIWKRPVDDIEVMEARDLLARFVTRLSVDGYSFTQPEMSHDTGNGVMNASLRFEQVATQETAA